MPARTSSDTQDQTPWTIATSSGGMRSSAASSSAARSDSRKRALLSPARLAVSVPSAIWTGLWSRPITVQSGLAAASVLTA